MRPSPHQGPSGPALWPVNLITGPLCALQVTVRIFNILFLGFYFYVLVKKMLRNKSIMVPPQVLTSGGIFYDLNRTYFFLFKNYKSLLLCYGLQLAVAPLATSFKLQVAATLTATNYKLLLSLFRSHPG